MTVNKKPFCGNGLRIHETGGLEDILLQFALNVWNHVNSWTASNVQVLEKVSEYVLVYFLFNIIAFVIFSRWIKSITSLISTCYLVSLIH